MKETLSIAFSLARVAIDAKSAKPKIIMAQVEGFRAALLIVARRVNDEPTASLRPPRGCLRAAGAPIVARAGA
jgi:hypothetical protein